MKKNNRGFIKTLIIITIVVLAIGGGVFVYTREKVEAPIVREPVAQTEPIVCTMDAFQCPDGSWVGRSGPKCEFVCPKQIQNKLTQTDYRIVSRGSYSKYEYPEEIVLLNSNELRKLSFSMYSNYNNMPSVDFSKEIALAVFNGQSSTGGYSISFDKIEEGSDSIKATIIRSSPGSGCNVTTAVTSPFEIIAIKKTDKPIVFESRKIVTECN